MKSKEAKRRPWRCAVLVISLCSSGAAADTGGPSATKAAGPAPAGGAEPATAGDAGKTKEPAATPSPEKKVPRTYLEFAMAGGPVMVPLALLSVVFLAFLAERVIRTRRGRVLPPALVNALASDPSPDPAHVRTLCAAHPSAAATILKAMLGRLDGPIEDLERGVNNAAQREIHSLRRNLRVFSIIATVAPLLGLLGTVTGLIGAFREVSIQGLGQGQAYAAGIYEALANTAAGLIVAIPALIAYHWLMARIDGFVHRIDFLVIDYVDARRKAVAA